MTLRVSKGFSPRTQFCRCLNVRSSGENLHVLMKLIQWKVEGSCLALQGVVGSRKRNQRPSRVNWTQIRYMAILLSPSSIPGQFSFTRTKRSASINWPTKVSAAIKSIKLNPICHPLCRTELSMMAVEETIIDTVAWVFLPMRNIFIIGILFNYCFRVTANMAENSCSSSSSALPLITIPTRWVVVGLSVGGRPYIPVNR